MSTSRVMTFNIRHCRGLDEVVDVQRVAAVINGASPALVALQEVDVGLERSGTVDQAAELAAATGAHLYFHPTIERKGGLYGIAVAADVPLQVTALDLPRLGAEEPRSVLLASWRGATVLATHLSRHRKARSAQLEMLGSLAASAGRPVVLLGDLNADHGSLGALRAAGLEGPHIATHPARRPRAQKDHVLVSPSLRVASAAAIPTEASDHLPMVADLYL